MNLILILKQLWQRKLLVVLAVLAAAALSILAVFQVTTSPPFVEKKTESYAQGTIEILVDSARSPIADAQRDLTGLTARAAVFARYMSGGDVIGKIAKANGISPKEIDIEGSVALPSAAPGVEEPSPKLHPYGISVTAAGELPILSVVTRAPEVEEAETMAAAAPGAIRQVVEGVQNQQDTPARQRVEFRELGPARAAVVDDAMGKKIAAILFLVLLSIFLFLIVAWPRFKAAWRSAAPDDPAVGLPPQQHPVDDQGDVVQLPPTASGPHPIDGTDPGLLARRSEP